MSVAVLSLSLAACGGGGGSGDPPPVYHTLSVAKAGSGSGTVTGGGVSCGASCSASLPYGTAVTLTASSDAGSAFTGWVGCDTAAGATCNVTVTTDRTVTATFEPAPYTLSVQKLGSGSGAVTGAGGAISCGATCTASLPSGAPATLTASAAAGSTFAGWLGCDSASGTTCNVTMTADHAVTATFNLVDYTLAVQKTGSGSGTVTGGGISCGASCSASLPYGTAVTLTASPAVGSAFAGWVGCDSVTGATCNVTMTSGHVVTATFNLVDHTLAVQKTGGGSGAVTGGGGVISCGASCTAPLPHGTPVTLTASPAVGSNFGGWIGCDSATGATCTVTMTANRTVTATFNLVDYTLAVSKLGSGAGTVTSGDGAISCGANCSALLPYGTPVALTAAPGVGSTFAGWVGCDSVTGATCNVTLTADRVVTATFNVTSGDYTLAVQKTGSGSGTVTGGGGAINCGVSCSAPFAPGTPVTLTAATSVGSSFAGWVGCDSVSGATCTVTMTASRTVTATFNPVSHTVAVQKSGSGSGAVTGGGGAISCGATCTASLPYGTAVTLTASPAAGSTFAGWVGCETVTGATCNVTMTTDHVVTATFSLLDYTLAVQKAGSGSGAVTGGGGAISCGATCTASLPYGTAVTLAASADVGSTFAGWVGCDTVTGATCNVTMTAGHVVSATFNLVDYTLAVQKVGSGSGAVTGGGAISCGASCSASLPHGTQVTLTASPAVGSTFAGWAGCDSTTGATCSVTMTANRTVTATFNAVLYALSVQKTGSGSGTVAGGAITCGATCTASLAPGTAVTLTAAPAAGSTFGGWLGCDSATGTTCNVTMTADRIVTATFNASLEYTLSVSKSGAGSGSVIGGAISCGATCSASFAAGAAVSLTAWPDPGSAFGGWSGCDTSTGTTCDLTMGANRTVTATFVPVQYTLGVSKSGAGTGTVSGNGISCGATCSASVASGTAVTLTAVAEAGSSFATWSGCDSVTGATCSLTMTTHRTVTATFNPVEYTLAVQKSGNGSGTVTGGGGAIACGATCSALLPHGTLVTLTASAAASSTLMGWTGCDSNPTATTCSFTMNADRTVTATFDTGNGSLRVSNDSGFTITQLYAAAPGAPTWGANQLTAPIPSPGTFTLTNIAAGTWDFRAVAADGTYWQNNSVAIAVGGLVTWALLPPSPGVATLTVANTSTLNIAQLYVSAAGTGNWGPNQLASPILAGSTRNLTSIPAGTYDLLAVASDGFSYWQTNSVTMTGGSIVTWTLVTPEMGALDLVNNHCVKLAELYVTPSSSFTRSPNLIAGTPVDPDGVTFTLAMTTGTYYVEAVATDSSYWATPVTIAAGATHTWQLFMPGGTGCIRVVNNTNDTIEHLYAARSTAGCSSNLWGNDWLFDQATGTGSTIPPNTSFTMSLLQPGAYDTWAWSPATLPNYEECGAFSVYTGGTFVWYLVPP